MRFRAILVACSSLLVWAGCGAGSTQSGSRRDQQKPAVRPTAPQTRAPQGGGPGTPETSLEAQFLAGQPDDGVLSRRAEALAMAAFALPELEGAQFRNVRCRSNAVCMLTFRPAVGRGSDQAVLKLFGFAQRPALAQGRFVVKPPGTEGASETVVYFDFANPAELPASNDAAHK